MNEELKPCPFCGGEAETLEEIEMPNHCRCANANCPGHDVATTFEYWNRRRPCPATVATEPVAQEEVSNEQIREMARERLMAIPRVICHENGNCYNHADGNLLHADFAMQEAMEVVDDVILACAATWSAANPAEQAVADLLAIIHGDGGHYQAEHGTEKAARDAIAKHNELRATLAYMGSPLDAVAQGGRVDVERVMALVDAFGRSCHYMSSGVTNHGRDEAYADVESAIRALLSSSPDGVAGFDILKRNAARYQWVRHNAGYMLYCEMFGDVGMREFTDHDLDADIDRQIRHEAWRPAYQPYLTDNGARWVHDCRNSDRTFLAHLSPCPHCGVAAPAIANQEPK